MAEDKELSVEQSGFGFTPVIGINITPFENLNIGLKYELRTKVKLTNNTTEDGFGLFPDQSEITCEIPAILGVGIGYKPVEQLEVQFSFTNYFDKGADWGLNFRDRAVYPDVDSMIREREIDKNSFETGLGLEFKVSENFSVSLGGSYFRSGVAESYQSDFSFSNSSFSAGGGFSFRLTEDLSLDAGFSYTGYMDAEARFSHPQFSDGYADVFSRSGMRVGVGVEYRVGK
jgi:opacity protein-like surface antigen